MAKSLADGVGQLRGYPKLYLRWGWIRAADGRGEPQSSDYMALLLSAIPRGRKLKSGFGWAARERILTYLFIKPNLAQKLIFAF